MDRDAIEGEYRVVGETPAQAGAHDPIDWPAGLDLLGRTLGGLALLVAVAWAAPKLNAFFYGLFFG